MQQFHRNFHSSYIILIEAAILLVLLLFLTACRIDVASAPTSESDSSSASITNTVPMTGTPPAIIQPEIFLSRSDSSVKYPALRVITQEVRLRDFAMAWNTSGLEITPSVDIDLTEIKMKWLQVHNRAITTTLSPNQNIILPQFTGKSMLSNELLSYVQEQAVNPVDLSQDNSFYTLIVLNTIDKNCFEETTGISLENLSEYNFNLSEVVSKNIPEGTVIFIPEYYFQGMQNSVQITTSCLFEK